MKKIPNLWPKEWTMKRKLFGYMLLLAAILLLTLMVGLFLFGRFRSTEQKVYEILDLQMEVFEKDVSSCFDHLAASGIRFSEDVTVLVEDYLEREGINFADLSGDDRRIAKLQEHLLTPIHQKLLQEECSGIFLLLNTTVSEDTDGIHRSGIYLQENGYETTHKGTWLYRGIAEVGKKYDIMPHRKWRMEFSTERFPDYDALLTRLNLPLYQSYSYTDLFVLPGTSEEAMLLTVPVLGSDGAFYGICGFEISISCFKTCYMQPTKEEHLICLMTPETSEKLNLKDSFVCGTAAGYFRKPEGNLYDSTSRGDLTVFTGEEDAYVGVTRSATLSPNEDRYTLAVMIPKADYDGAVREDFLRNLLLWLLLLFFTVSCCLYFSRRFLAPILQALEQVSMREKPDLAMPEINHLFAFLDEQDKMHEAALQSLHREKEEIRQQIDRLQTEYDAAIEKYNQAQNEISRLAYSRKQEVDPDDYQRFLAGIQTLTAAERRIFDLYLSGRNVKEIIAALNIKESTLRYHNQNIYGKLGVNSLKQLLRYAALMRQEKGE